MFRSLINELYCECYTFKQLYLNVEFSLNYIYKAVKYVFVKLIN